MSGGSSAQAPVPLRSLEAWLGTMSERTRALLEYHFDHDASGAFTLATSLESADVVVLDYDYPGAKAAVASGAWLDGPPLMVLAHGAPAVDGVLVLAKPLDRASLGVAAERLREGGRPVGRVGPSPAEAPIVATVVSSAEAIPASPARTTGRAVTGVPIVAPASEGRSSGTRTPSSEERAAGGAPRGLAEPPLLELAPGRRRPVPPDPSAVAGPPASDERARARVNALCGPARTLSELSDAACATHRYEPTRHLSGHLAAAFRTLESEGAGLRGLMLTFPDVELYVLPWLDRICISEPLNWKIGVDRVFHELEDDDVALATYRPSTVNTLVSRVNERAAQAFPIAAFRWLAALFSAGGRLPRGVDVRTPYRLAHWPDFPRLEMTPHCMAVAAAWTDRSRSIADVTARVGCEPRHVTSLFAAATAAGLLRPADQADGSLTDDEDDDVS